jgi:hypothetical protein
MGYGSGGARPGSGPKGREDVPAEPLPVLPPPGGLREAERRVWEELAPLAAVARTLTPETAGALVDLCHLITMRDRVQRAVETEGLTYEKITIDGAGQEHRERKRHPLLGEWRALTQRIEAGRVRFRLAPMGKPLAGPPVEQRQSALDRLKVGPVGVVR